MLNCSAMSKVELLSFAADGEARMRDSLGRETQTAPEAEALPDPSNSVPADAGAQATKVTLKEPSVGGGLRSHLLIMPSIGRQAAIVSSEETLKAYVAVFRSGNVDDATTIQRLENWIELVASRSQTLLQFNSVAIAILALRGSQGGSYAIILAGVWVLISLPLLLNIFVFLNAPEHYRPSEALEIPWTLRNASLRSLVFNVVLFLSAICAILAAIITMSEAGAGLAGG